MKASFYLLPVIFFILSCNHPFGRTTGLDPAQLTESSIYDIDSVRATLGGGNEKAAAKKLGQAIDIYKNVKDPAKSIDLFKSAIRLTPSPRAYYELGSALLDDGRYAESIRALRIAEKLGYSPLANVMFKLSAAYADHHKGDAVPDDWRTTDSLSLHYMEVAIQMGFAHPEQFRSGELFKRMVNDYAFNAVYTAALSGGSGSGNPEKMLWHTFTTEFAPVELPLTINTVWIQSHKLENSISYDYEKFIPEMRNAKFSREVENDYYYYALVKKDPAYTALLYAGKNNFLSDANQNSPVFFFLVTYDGDGKIIDKMPVAGQKNFTATLKVFTMQPNYAFVVKDYKNIFKYDPETVGYDSNYVVKSEPLGISSYRIAPNGKFEKTDAPLAMR